MLFAGVYFINGHFVSNTEQVILLDKYTNLPSYRIGFNVAESFTTPEEDTSLLDNATGSSNVNAPGAHRFKIALTLVKKAITSTDDTNFVELGRIKNGKIESYKKNADYSELQHTLARRTFDESGNYEVRPFLAEVREHLKEGSNRGIYPLADGGNTNKLVFAVEPGKAYVDGYEIETMTTQFVKADKPRTFDRVEDRTIQTPIGNFVLVTNIVGSPNISTFETLNLRDQTIGDTSGNTVIGTARVRFFILHDGSYSANPTFKLGLFDIKMNEGKDFARDVKSINDHASIGGTGSDFEADIKPTFVAISGVGTGTNSATGVTGAQGSVFTQQLKAKDRLIAKINGVETDVGRISTFTNNASLTLSANASATFTDATLGRFSSQIFRPDQKLLVFPTNFRRVRKIRGDTVSAPDSALSTSYSVRRKFAPRSVNTSTNVVDFSLTGTDVFRNTSNINDFTLIITAGSGAGTIVQLDSSNTTVDTNTSQTVTFTGITNGTQAELIATVDLSGSSAQEKIKTLVTGASHPVSTQAEAQNTEIKLGKSDGLRLTSVKMSANFNDPATSSDPDITSRFTFDGGQRDAFYDLARLNLKPGQPAPTGRLLITFDHFTHSAGDYFSVDSYPTLYYEYIPIHSSP